MIKKTEDSKGFNYMASGEGIPFDMPVRYPVEKNDAERQVPKMIDLMDLNGTGIYAKGMPKNFDKSQGRIFPEGQQVKESKDIK